MAEQNAGQRLGEIFSRISKLPRANLEPPQFFANFLQLTIAGTGSVGGAIWLMQEDKGPQCYCHLELEKSGLNESQEQQKLIVEAVGRVIGEKKPVVMPSGGVSVEGGLGVEVLEGSQCGSGLFFQPLRAGGQVAMVLQLIGSPNLQVNDYASILRLAAQAADAAETFLAHRRATVLDDDRKALARLLQFAEGVHGSLDPQKVIYEAVNLGRDVIKCTRAVAWVDPAVKRQLLAVSGVDKPDKRGVLLVSVDKLCRHCLEIKKPIVASRAQLPELDEQAELTGLLKSYFHVSNLDDIYLQPLEGKNGYLGVLVVEGFDAGAGANMAGLISAVSKHTSLALANALEMASLPMMKPLARMKQAHKDPKKRKKTMMWTVGIVLFVVLMLLVPWTVKIDCACELTPLQKRVIDSPLDGLQIASVEIASGRVSKGQVIIKLNSDELNTRLFTLEADLQREQVNMKQAIRSADKRLSELQVERLESQIMLVNSQIEKTSIRSPIDGVILTEDLELKEGLTVKIGEPILEVADLDNWQLSLEVPQKEIGWVQMGLAERAESTDELLVEFYLAAYPEYRLSAGIRSRDQIAQMARVGQEEHVYEIKVDVPGESFGDMKGSLRSGSEGRAKIATTERALGYVLLRKVIRFFRVTFFEF